MNDFDDRLGNALRDDDLDSTQRPDLDGARRGWQRRRQSRLAGTAGVLSVLVVGAGFGIAALAQNDPPERLVTDTVPITVSTTAPVNPIPTVTAPTIDPAPSTSNDPSATEASTTEPPGSTGPTSSAPAAEPRGLEVADGFVARTTVFDIDNRLEIRSSANKVLWSHQYCEVEQRCSASVQTVLDDGFWVLVGDSTDINGYPESSTLRRVGVDGTTVEVRAQSPSGTYFAAAQPTVLGELVAVAVQDPFSGRLIDVSITEPDGQVVKLIDNVGNVEVSADGRYVATTTSRPSEGFGPYLAVFDLQTGQANEIKLEGLVSAAPIEFSADGSWLVLRDTWENQRDFVIDPWMDTPAFLASEAPVTGSEICLVDESTAAVATWNVGYGENSVTTGTVRLVDIETGEARSDFGLETFGRQLVCHPDGSISFVRVPLVERNYGTEGEPFMIVEQDFDASVDVVRVTVDATLTVLESGDLSIWTVR